MKIEEQEDVWHITFFPEASDKQFEDHLNDKGWQAMIGLYKDVNVPKYINYSKSKFSLNDAIRYAQKITECSICKNLNENVEKITSIDIKTSSDHIENKYKSERPMSKKSADMFKDMVMSIFFDTFFTKPGMFLIGSLLDDDTMISRALPESIDDREIAGFTAELAAFFAGEIPLIRSPEELQRYVAILREKQKPPEKEEEQKYRNYIDIISTKLGEKALSTLL